MWNWSVNNIAMQPELNLNLNFIEFQFNQVQFNNCVKIKFHWKKKRCKLVEKVLKHFHEYGVEKITLKGHESKKTPFHGSSLGNGLKYIPICNLWWFMEHQVVLPKPITINRSH